MPVGALPGATAGVPGPADTTSTNSSAASHHHHNNGTLPFPLPMLTRPHHNTTITTTLSINLTDPTSTHPHPHNTTLFPGQAEANMPVAVLPGTAGMPGPVSLVAAAPTPPADPPVLEPPVALAARVAVASGAMGGTSVGAGVALVAVLVQMLGLWS